MARSSSRLRARSGGALVAAIICLGVVSLVGMSLVRSALSQHRTSRQHERRLQALWLAESAVERTRLQLAAAPEEVSPLWRPVIDGESAGVVAIHVSPPVEEGEETPRTIRVEARWPDDSVHGVAHVREFTWTPR
jgi:type II secretory pathway component PulJ